MMKKIGFKKMEKLHGGKDLPTWFKCGLAVTSTVLMFVSIFAGNIAGIIAGPTLAGTALAVCFADIANNNKE